MKHSIQHSPVMDIADSLLARNDLDPYAIGQQLQRVASNGVDFSDVYIQFDEYDGWSIEDGMVKSGHYAIEQGLGVRAISGEKTAFAYADDLNMTSLMQAVDTVKSIANSSLNQSIQIPTFSRQIKPALYSQENPIASWSTAQKIACLHEIDQMARQYDSRVRQVIAGITSSYSICYIMNTLGVMVADVRPLVHIRLQVIVEHNGIREQGSSGGGGRTTLALFDHFYLTQMVKEACDSALLNLDAKPAPAGSLPVVLGPGWPGILLHEAVGHGLEGDFNRKGSSTFAAKLGQKIAADQVTVVDDGTLPHLRGSLSVDDEGFPTGRNVLIENGILVGYLHDYLSSKLMGVKPTGNGRRESYASIPLPRMTNTFMLAGQTDPQEIIESVKDGIYATQFGGGQVDITNGQFVFSASQAWRIENGRLTYPIRGATIAGDGATALRHVSMIGNDLALDRGVGVCGKEGQSVPVGVGQPTLRIDHLTVGGTAHG